MEIKTVKIDIPDGCNIILGQTHFIKTAEDLYEIIATTVPAGEIWDWLYRGLRAMPYKD